MNPLAPNLRDLRTAALALCFVVGLADCRKRHDPSTAPGNGTPGVSAHCVDGYSEVTGPYRYENNQWGKGKAHGDFEQCLIERKAGEKTEWGWSWNWPGFDPSVFSYPEIIFGWKPWSGGKSTDPRFPLRVADVHELEIRYAVETEASGNYNLAPEIWLIDKKTLSNASNPGAITTEIMFWMESAGEARPAGRIIDHAAIGGIDYELWKEDSIGDKGSGASWVLYSFRSPETRRSGTIPVHALLAYLRDKGAVNPAEYVASVEFGNEISGGAGTTWVRTFEVEVRP